MFKLLSKYTTNGDKTKLIDELEKNLKRLKLLKIKLQKKGSKIGL